MNEFLENDFIKKIQRCKDKVNILHFSTGADSVACFLKLRENGIEPVLVYKYFLPELPMVKNYIDYFEKKFNVHIYQFPSTLYAEHTDNALYQFPVKAREKFRNKIGLFGLENYSKDGFDKALASCFNEEVVFHLGFRYTDGLNRYRVLSKYGCMCGNKFYPIASFKVSDIQDILRKYETKLPIEYGLWGISFESPRSFNINLIKENCPLTYNMIKERFPLIGALGLRDVYTGLNQHFKQRLAQYKNFAMEKGDLIW